MRDLVTSALFLGNMLRAQNIYSPYVFEFWEINMLREVPMRMFSS